MEKINEVKSKDQHLYYTIETDNPNIEVAINEINKGLDSILSQKRCNKCGSIQPEIRLNHDGKCFIFTCTEINNTTTNELILKSDYKTLCHYLMSQGYGAQSEEAYNKWCDEHGIP
jgi:hypothetical protein